MGYIEYLPKSGRGALRKCKKTCRPPSSIQPPRSECVECGCCPLIHRSFTLEKSVNPTVSTTIPVLEAPGWIPACIPGQAENEEPSGTAFPFGTLIVSNVGANPFDVAITGPDNDIDFTATVIPGAQVAFTGVIQRVDAILPPNPCHALFHFDLFQYPPNPV